MTKKSNNAKTGSGWRLKRYVSWLITLAMLISLMPSGPAIAAYNHEVGEMPAAAPAAYFDGAAEDGGGAADTADAISAGLGDAISEAGEAAAVSNANGAEAADEAGVVSDGGAEDGTEDGAAVNADDVAADETGTEAGDGEPAVADEPDDAGTDELGAPGTAELGVPGTDDLDAADIEEPAAIDADAQDAGEPGLPDDIDAGDQEIAALNGVLIHEARFFIGTELYENQYVADGACARFVGAPPKSRYPEGYSSFTGWYEAGAPDGEPFDFDAEITSDIELFARFDNKYLVQYVNGFGDIFASELVTYGTSINEPPSEWSGAIAMPHGKYFQFWTQSTMPLYPPYDFGAATITGDTVLYPALGQMAYVYFVTGGSEVFPLRVKAGETAAKPADPVRDNYSFRYWSAKPNGPEYNWNAPVAGDLTLYAVWHAIPDSVNYKVIWWLEAPGLTVAPMPFNPEHYVYAESEIRRGTPGEMVWIESEMPPNYGPGLNPEDPLRYAEYDYSFPAVISNDGGTVVNVYLKRKIITLAFDLGSDDYWLRFYKSDDIYYGDSYKINVKYEQDITDIWPSTSTAEFGFGESTYFSSWSPDGSSFGGGAYATRRNTVTYDMMPVDPAQQEYTLYANTMEEQFKLSARYYIEPLPGEESDEFREFAKADGEDAKIYILDRRYDQDGIYHINPKLLPGLECVGRDYSDEEFGESTWETYSYMNFYYDRMRHSITYETGGGTPIGTAEDIMFRQPIAEYKPDDPIRQDYVFMGWYKDPDFVMLFDFDMILMPAYDLTAYAKWEFRDHTVYLYDGADSVGSIKVRHGEAVDLSAVPGGKYNLGQYFPGKGMFIGWRYYDPRTGESVPYPPEMPAYRDTVLYADWYKEGYTVLYHYDGSGPGSVIPVDINRYAAGTLARVLRGDIVPPSEGHAFVGWREGWSDPDVVHYPDDIMEIRAQGFDIGYGSLLNMFLTFTGYSEDMSVTFDKNIPDDPEEYSRPVQKNTHTQLPGSSVFSRVPDNYSLAGWQTEPDGGAFYALTALYPTGEASSTLYAVWDISARYANIIFDGNYGLNGSGAGAISVAVLAGNTYLLEAYQPAPGDMFAKPGFEFAGWTLARDNFYSKQTIISVGLDDVTVYAYWQEIEEEYVTLYFDGNGGINKSLQGIVGVRVPMNSVQYLSQIQPAGTDMFRKAGYEFLCWTRARNSIQQAMPDRVVIGDTDGIIYAYWRQAPDVALTFDGNGGIDSNGAGSCRVMVKVNSTVLLADLQPAGGDMFAKGGAQFLGWALEKDRTDTISEHIDIDMMNVTVYACWTTVMGNVIFEGNGGFNAAGKDLVSVSVEAGLNHLIANIAPSGDNMFTKDGFVFDGWALERAFSEPRQTHVTAGYDYDVTLYATWKPAAAPKINVIFEANGGYNSLWQSIYVAQAPANSVLPIDEIQPAGGDMFIKPGFAFRGWTFAKNDGGNIITDLETGAGNIAVYALWEAAEDVKVIFNGNGGANIAGQHEFKVSAPGGSKQTLANIQPAGGDMFKLDGYVFDGWSTDQGDVSSRIFIVELGHVDKTVYALWRRLPDVYVVFFGNGGVSSQWQASYYVPVPVCSTQIVADIAPVGVNVFYRPGYEFVGWTSSLDDGDTIETVLNIEYSNRILFAHWKIISKVNIIFDGAGGVNKDNKGSVAVPVPRESKQTLSLIQPSGDDLFKLPGFVLDGWSTVKGDALYKKRDIDVHTSDETVYALWKPVPNVSVIFFGNGGVNSKWQTSYIASVPANSSVVLADIEPKGGDMFAKAGAVFAGWSASPNGEEPIGARIDVEKTNKILYAYWAAPGGEAKVTFKGNGGESDTGKIEYSVNVPFNSTQSVSAIEPKGAEMFKRSGYTFAGWTAEKDDPESAKTQLIIGTLNVTLFALWEEIPQPYVSIIFNANGGASAGKPGVTEFTVNVEKNTTQLLAIHEPSGEDAFVRSGYTFEGWTEAKDVEGTLRVTLNVGEINIMVYALWKKVPDELVSLKFNGNGGFTVDGHYPVMTIMLPQNSTHAVADLVMENNIIFAKPGCTFVGWTGERDELSTKKDIVELTTGEMTLYAYWAEIADVKLIFDANGGSTIVGGYQTVEIAVPVNTTVKISDILRNSGIGFWKPDKYLEGFSLQKNDYETLTDYVDVMYEDVTVYALWIGDDDEEPEVATVNLIFDGNGGLSMIDGNSSFTLAVPVNSTQNLLDLMYEYSICFIKSDPFFRISDCFTLEPNNNHADTVVIKEEDVTVYAYWSSIN